MILDLLDDRFAVVHVVWQGPQRPPWPTTRLFADFNEVVEYVEAHAEL